MDVSRPVARTAFYCCALRADDATSPTPICGDRFAGLFINDAVRSDIAPLLRFSGPSASNVARHRIVDDIVRDRLSSDPARRIILIGAGLDTRAFRLTGGQWFELDDPQLLTYKEARLAAGDAPNPLVRIPVVFQAEAPDRYLAPLAGDDQAIVILEGVSMYLPDGTITELAAAIGRTLPRATLVCDLMSPAFFSLFSRGLGRQLRNMGAAFAERTTHPSHAIERAGYSATQRFSIVDRAREAGATRIPRWLLNTLLRELRDGYAIWVFNRRPG